MPSQQVLEQKMSEVQEIAKLVKQHKVIGIASLQKVRQSVHARHEKHAHAQGHRRKRQGKT
jgi:hypothetical protein